MIVDIDEDGGIGGCTPVPISCSIGDAGGIAWGVNQNDPKGAFCASARFRRYTSSYENRVAQEIASPT